MPSMAYLSILYVLNHMCPMILTEDIAQIIPEEQLITYCGDLIGESMPRIDIYYHNIN